MGDRTYQYSGRAVFSGQTYPKPSRYSNSILPGVLMAGGFCVRIAGRVDFFLRVYFRFFFFLGLESVTGKGLSGEG